MARRRSYILPLMAAVVLPILASALLSCADLSVIEENRCGNGFVEKGEDCDALGGDARSVCIAPGQVNQCHWQCKVTADCRTSIVSSADSGWRCGVDGVCRQPEGEFVETGTLAPGNAAELLTGDFDGDGRVDVLAVTLGGFDIHYFDDQLALAKSLQVPSAPVVPAVGKLTGDLVDPAKLDLTDDFTFNVGPGLSVMRGTTDQTVDPTSYLSFDITGLLASSPLNPKAEDIRIIPVRLGAEQGTTELAYLALADFAFILNSLNPDLKAPIFNVPAGKKIVGDIPTARLKASGECDNFALAFQGDTSITVYNPSLKNKSMTKVNLPSGSGAKPDHIEGRAFLTDVNGDGNTDVLVGALCEDKTCAELDVAYGDGNGGFFDGTDFLLATPGKATPYLLIRAGGTAAAPSSAPALINALPLTLGRLNNDSALDYVDATSIRVSNSVYLPGADADTTFTVVGAPSTGSWTDARIGDFNGNSRPDVVGSSNRNAGIDFFNGTGSGVFNQFLIPTDGFVDHLTIGDFDGDLLGDIAYDDIIPIGKDNLRHTLSVAFGRPSGAPDLPVKMGTVQDLLQLAPCNVAEFATDAATDLSILAGSPGDPKARWRVGLSQGNGYRQLQVPIVNFGPGKGLVDSRPVASAIGAFDSKDTHADIAVVSDTLLAPDGHLITSPSIWLLPSTDDAMVESPKPAHNVKLPGLFVSEPQFTRLVPIDLDSSGHDSLLVAGIEADACTNNVCSALAGALLVTKADSTGEKFADPTAVHPLDDNWFHWRIRVGDINNDKLDDVVSIQVHIDSSYSFSDDWRAVVLLNDGHGALLAPVQIDPGPGLPIDLALVNVDGIQDKEIAILVRKEGSTRSEVHLLDWTPKGAKLVTDLHPATGGEYDRQLSFESARALAGGDFNGDGVDDLAVAAAGGVRILKGVVK